MDRLTLLATHALSSVIFGFALAQHDGIGTVVGTLAGVVAFLCLRHLHDTMALARDKRELAEDLDFIRAANVSVRDAHVESKKKLIKITTALGRRMEAHENKVVAELQVLEGLLSALDSEIHHPRTRDIPAAARPAPGLARRLAG